jgi:hypothetical protein
MTLRVVILSTIRTWIDAAQRSRDRALVEPLRDAVDRIDPPLDAGAAGDRSSTTDGGLSDATGPTTFTVRLRGTRTSELTITGTSAVVQDDALLIYGAGGNVVFAAPFEVVGYCIRTDARVADARRRSAPSPRAAKRPDHVRPVEKGSTARQKSTATSDPPSSAQNDDAPLAAAAGS